MILSRREMLVGAATATTAAGLAGAAAAQAPASAPATHGRTPITTLMGAACPGAWSEASRSSTWSPRRSNTSSPRARRSRPGATTVRAPGPTIEAIEGDRVRILFTNRLPEHTTIHWHGIPCGMDGVGGSDAAAHPARGDVGLRIHAAPARHAHVTTAWRRDGPAGVGDDGLFIIHPKDPAPRERVDRDFACCCTTGPCTLALTGPTLRS